MPKVAYLTGTYPRATDTFIQREIAAHREAGWNIATFAVRPPEDGSLTSEAQRRERERTSYLLERRGEVVRDALRAAWRWIARVPRTVRVAWGTRRPGLRGTLLQAAYLIEASALALRLDQLGIRHLHNHLGDSSCTVAMLSAELGEHSYSFTLHGPGIFFEAVTWQLGEKVRRAAFCACISDFARAQAAIFAPDQLEALQIVRCGVDPEAYSPRRRERGRSNLICVARLAPIKGLCVLLDAVSRLAEHKPDVSLTVVGEGPERAALMRRARRLGIEDRVHFAGSRSPAEVADMLAAADVFVLPSFAEGVPVVLMEAMASELPVVATRVGGVSELVEDRQSGYLVAPGNAEQLASRVADVLCDHDRAAAMGRAGRKRVEMLHDTVAEAARLRRLMQAYV